MQVGVLGALVLLTDDGVLLLVPGTEERLLLAALTAGAPGVVSTDSLVTTLWDREPPPAARKSLHAHVVALRSCLEPGLPERSSGRYVLRRGAGYALAVAPGDVDALRIGALAARGHDRLAAGDAAQAERLFSAALALWRGEPYADWPGAPFAEEERRRLAGIRAGAVAGLRDARLRRAEPGPTVPASTRPPGDGRADHAARWTAGAVPRRPGAARMRVRRSVAVACLIAAAVATVAGAVRSQREADEAFLAAQADRLATLSTTEGPLDITLLLAVEAFRLDDTPRTRERLRAVVAQHARAEQAARFVGSPPAATLSGGGRTLTFGPGPWVVAWSVGPVTRPPLPTDVAGASWLVTSPSPPAENQRVPWLRMVSAVDGTSRLMLQGGGTGGRPVEASLSADGRRLLLLVAEPDAADPAGLSRWQLLDLAAVDGADRDTGIRGTFPGSVEGLSADFADDGGSFVLWGAAGTDSALLVDLADGRQTRLPVRQPPAGSAGFRALPTGAAHLWDDGTVTLVDGGGTTVQHLHAHRAPVRDLTVSPDGTWAATAGEGAAVFRWDIEPSTGRWLEPEPLPGHERDVVDLGVHAAGRSLVTVSEDQVIRWDMTGDGRVGEARRHLPAEPSAWLDRACAIVGRDFTRSEWDRYLPGRRYHVTCTDLL